ncbi:restriction endonuclease subunit S [Micromonospora sp. NPDC049102]|uniref:restriction endonuclease subunit S n=1 Tax=Micromonospora sp. NPDC049102 TaxID=3364265 RepID=UPI00371F5532
MSRPASIPLRDLLTEVKPGYACGEEAGDGILQIRMNNVTRDGQLDLSKKRLVPRQSERMEKFSLRPGDVLFNATNSPDLVGKTALFAQSTEAVFSNHFYRLRVDHTKVLPGYLARWLQMQFRRGVFKSMCQQWVNQATVNRDALLRLDFPVPALPQQRRINDVLDCMDKLRAERRQALAMLDELERSTFLQMFGDIRENNKRLTVARLGNLTDVGTGSTPPRSVATNYGGKIPWVKTAEVRGSRIMDTEEKITDSGRVGAKSHVFPADSIVVAMYGQGATRGRSAVLGVPAATNQACAVLLPSPNFETEFMFVQLKLSYERLRMLARGGNQANLNLKMVSEFEVLLPPLSQQRKFVAVSKEIEKLRAGAHSGSIELDALFASLQDKAFRGEL